MMRLWVTWCPFSLSMLWHHMAPEHSQMWPHKLQTIGSIWVGWGVSWKRKGPLEFIVRTVASHVLEGPDTHTSLSWGTCGNWASQLGRWQQSDCGQQQWRGQRQEMWGHLPQCSLASQSWTFLSLGLTIHQLESLTFLGYDNWKHMCNVPASEEERTESSFAPRDHALTH